MFSKKLLFTLLLSIMTIIYVFPQDEDTTETEPEPTSREHHHHRHNFNFTMFDGELSGRPTISANYGLSNATIKNFGENFVKPDLIELKLGYTHESRNFEEEGILDYSFKYFYVSNISTEINNASNGIDLKTDMWRFGFGRSTGYGWSLGPAAIIPYHTYTFGWSKLRMIDSALTPVDKETTNLYKDTFRFGTSMEGGIRFQVIRNITLEAGYERAVVFPRHIFWPWVGSVAIEAAGQWAIDSFVDKILDSSPYAVPIVSFVLKNALSYGIYELRHDKMNWPFDSASPLSYDQFKFGLTFVL